MVAALTIGFVYCWQLTLMLIGIVPLMMVGAYLETKQQVSQRMGRDQDEKKVKQIEQSGTDKDRMMDAYKELASETMHNIRTVAMLSLERSIQSDFDQKLSY